MLRKPVFELFGIALTAIGIMLIAFIHIPLVVAAGVVLFVAGIVTIYRHYVEMGAYPDVLDDLTE